MSHKEHIKDENRTIEDFLKIKFYKEGNFWRAYEWSAYLCEFFPNGLSENDKLKPTYKEIKGVDGGIIFVGLPTSSYISCKETHESSVRGRNCNNPFIWLNIIFNSHLAKKSLI